MMHSTGTSLACAPRRGEVHPGADPADWLAVRARPRIGRTSRPRPSGRLPRSTRLLMLVWLVLVLAPLLTVGPSALIHALLYLAPALLLLVPRCLNRDPAGRLLARLARPRRRARAARPRPSCAARVPRAVVWLPRGGRLIAMARAGRAPPVTPRAAVLALGL